MSNRALILYTLAMLDLHNFYGTVDSLRFDAYAEHPAVQTMLSCPATTPQHKIQNLLEGISKIGGIPLVADCLYRWALSVGYFSRTQLEVNEQLCFLDSDMEIEFRVQINVGRSKYSPNQQNSESLPPLHCAICKEQVGRPGKEKLRIFEFLLPGSGRRYFLQLTPFPLFPYHYVLILSDPEPMMVNERSVWDMFAFLSCAPGYTVCSNSDVEWAGASILAHHHFQVFKGLTLPVMTAGTMKEFASKACSVALLNYPLAVLRIRGTDENAIASLASGVIDAWKVQDSGRNTANLALKREPTGFAFYIFFRNPSFRTPEHLLRFKSEGVGVIEAAGMGIFPVPSGPDKDNIWAEIRTNGKRIMREMLGGLNPITQDREHWFYELIQQTIDGSGL